MPGKPNEQKGRKAAKSNFVKSNTRSKELGTDRQTTGDMADLRAKTADKNQKAGEKEYEEKKAYYGGK